VTIRVERDLLAAMLQSADAAMLATAELAADDLDHQPHRLIFTAVQDVLDAGDPVTGQSVLDRVDRAQWQQVAPEIATLEGLPVTAGTAGYCLRVLHREAERRRLTAAAAKAQQLAESETVDVADALTLVQAALDGVPRQVSDGGPVAAADVVVTTLDEIEAMRGRQTPAGLLTGFPDLDRMLHGLRPGQLVVVGARPSVGKSAFALDLARHAALRLQLPSLLITLEMSRPEIMLRLLAAEAGVPLDLLSTGNLWENDWSRLTEALPRILEGRLFIDDTATLTLPQIRARVRQYRRQHDVQLVVVDYLQLVSGARVENRQTEVADLSRGLKLAAKTSGVPIVALSQLNRASDQRMGKRPQLSDLRESGAIEQDSDIVMLLHRDLTESPEVAEQTELILAKNRNGPVGSVPLMFQAGYTRFVSAASAASWSAVRGVS
jgi:replicative DNA helicase